MKKILNFGSLNIDRVYSVDNFVRAGETKKSTKLDFFAGGKGLNQSLAIAKAGGNVFHAGLIGEDGNFLKEKLAQNKVNVDFIKTIDSPTGHAIIQVNQAGENCILLDAGANDKIDKSFIDEVLSNFEKDDFLVLQNEISNLSYLIDEAYKKGMQIILNPSPINEDLLNLDLEKISYLLVNEIEGQALTGESDFEEILNKFNLKYPNLRLVLTLGSKGSIFNYKKLRIHQNPYKVTAVDTTAAGDTFTGYFIANIAKEKDINEILDISSKASAICVTRKGASDSVPTREEVINFKA